MTIGSKSGPRAKCGRRQELSEFDQWEVHIRIQNTEHLLLYHFIRRILPTLIIITWIDGLIIMIEFEVKFSICNTNIVSTQQ